MKRSVEIPINDNTLFGELSLPEDAIGLVVFAHGSGSSRFSPRNQAVADVINSRSCGTLLIDLLTQEEEGRDMRTREHRFDIEMLSERLTEVVDWVHRQSWGSGLKLGYFGSSTGGGAALMASAKRPDNIHAVVSRGGRPDLAKDYLPQVKAPTLLIVGQRDPQVIQLNETAKAAMTASCELQIIPNATHLFEESGALEAVAHQAADWFVKQFE